MVPHGGIGVGTSLAAKQAHQYNPVVCAHVVHHQLTIRKGFVAQGAGFHSGPMESTVTISGLLGIDGMNPFRM